MGLDIASNVGWSLIDETKLIEFGNIKCEQPLPIQMKVNYYYDEITRLIKRTQPDICVLEDIIMGISGVKVLVYLSRLNAAGILASVKSLNAYKVFLYTPAEWKKSCGLNIAGNAQKWEIQLEVCKKYNLISVDDEIFKKWNEMLGQEEIKKKLKEEENNILLNSKKELIQSLNRTKQKVLSLEEKNLANIKLIDITAKINQNLNDKKQAKKQLDKYMNKLSNDIYYKTGISTDIADSVGLSLCYQKLNKGEVNNGQECISSVK